jgi:hypothetical protein
MRPRKSTRASVLRDECASGRDELKAEIGMDRQRLTLCRDDARLAAPDSGDQEQAAREFYEGALGGRQVWPTGPRAAARKLWFLVGSTLIRVNLMRSAEVVEACVDSPAGIAERCWDAGYSVRLRADDSDDFIVIDPFGRQIMLTTRMSCCSFEVGAAG